MKKWLSAVCALLLVLTLAAPARAADSTDSVLYCDQLSPIARILYDKAHVLAHVACQSVHSKRRAEAVHIRPCVAHDKDIAGVFYKLAEHVSHYAALALVALFDRRKRAAVVLCLAAFFPDDRLVASAPQGKVEGRSGSVLKLFERGLAGAYSYRKRCREVRLGLDIVHGIEYGEALLAKL